MKRKLLKLTARILLKISAICFRLTGPAMWLHDRLDDLHVWFDKKGDRILVRLEDGALAGLCSPYRYGLEPERGITVIRDGKPYPIPNPPPIGSTPLSIDGQKFDDKS